MNDEQRKETRSRTWRTITRPAAEMADPARLHRMAEAFRHNGDSPAESASAASTHHKAAGEDTTPA